jgi:hypothetical protein
VALFLFQKQIKGAEKGQKIKPLPLFEYAFLSCLPLFELKQLNILYC